MKDKIEQVKARFQEEMQSICGTEELEKIRVAYLGKKGLITDLMKNLKDLNADAKREAGQQINQLKQQVSEFIAAKSSELEAALAQARLQQDTLFPPNR